jgi:hypothetical protein
MGKQSITVEMPKLRKKIQGYERAANEAFRNALHEVGYKVILPAIKANLNKPSFGPHGKEIAYQHKMEDSLQAFTRKAGSGKYTLIISSNLDYMSELITGQPARDEDVSELAKWAKNKLQKPKPVAFAKKVQEKIAKSGSARTDFIERTMEEIDDEIRAKLTNAFRRNMQLAGRKLRRDALGDVGDIPF